MSEPQRWSTTFAFALAGVGSACESTANCVYTTVDHAALLLGGQHDRTHDDPGYTSSGPPRRVH